MKRLILLSGLTLSLACHANEKKISTENDKTLYTLGQVYAKRVGNLSLTSDEVEMMLVGMRDGLLGAKAQVDIDAQQGQVQKFIEEKMSKGSQAEKDNGKKYVENFLKEDGAKRTNSGLAYRIVKPGSAKMPISKDSVEVHYHGTLIDGRVFDSSVDRGEKISFPLNGVIPGWTEGLQLIGEGGEIKLVIPSDLAYGDRGSPPAIPGGATLVFNVSLFRVNPK